ncbi:unnamed protein product, partial [Oppiella nova]
MSINIMSEQLFRNHLMSIECKQIASDMHSIDNLFADDVQRRQLGFRTEPYIRPPIEITLRSTFKMNVKELEIGLKLNDNKSDSLEISSASDSQEFQIITKQFNCHSFDSLCLKNVCFRLNSTLSSVNTSATQRDNCPLRHTTRVHAIKCFKNCFQINAIKIKIFRTANSSV